MMGEWWVWEICSALAATLGMCSTVQSAVRTAAIDDGLLNEISSPRGACNVCNGRYRPAGSERLPAAACHAGVRPSRRYGRTA
jgi:hypothetical protein